MSANNTAIWQWQTGGDELLRREDWESLRRGLEYGKEKVPKKEESAEIQKIPEKPISTDFSGVFQWIVIALIAVALILVILRLLGVRNFNRRVKGRNYGFTQTPILPDEPGAADNELDISVNEGDYRNAIRLLYLFVLKAYHEKGLLKWKKDKTNSDYLRELRNHGKYATFKKLTRLYEQVWFGESEIDSGMYGEARICYESLISEQR